MASPFPLILAGASALFFGTANPFLHLPLAIALYPSALALLGLISPHPFRHGWWTGLLGASASLYWIAVAVHDYGFFPWAAAVPCAMALGMYVGLWGGLFCRLMEALRLLPPWRRCLAGALGWYALEWTRGWLGTGFPWLTLSGGLAAWPELIQPVSLVGEYGYSGLLAGLGCLLAEAAVPAIKRKDVSLARPVCGPSRMSVGMPRRYAGAAAILAALCCGFGFWRVHLASPFTTPTAPLTVSLVQGNVNQAIKWDAAFQAATVDKYLHLSRQTLDNPDHKPDLILWPETALPFFWQTDTLLAPRIRAFAAEAGVPLLFGGPGLSRTRKGENALHNRAFLLNAKGEDAGSYDKQHLVPFGEYVPPLLNLPLMASLTRGIGGFTPGAVSSPFPLPDDPASFAAPPDGTPDIPAEAGAAVPARLGMLICYEAIFPELARERVAQGATILVNISNDAWYNRTAAPIQHLHLSLLRAVEQGRWLARATNTGVTAIISPLGEITSSIGDPATGSGLFTDAVLTGQVTPLAGRTVYFALHPWLPGLAILLFAVIVWPVRFRRRPDTPDARPVLRKPPAGQPAGQEEKPRC